MGYRLYMLVCVALLVADLSEASMLSFRSNELVESSMPEGCGTPFRDVEDYYAFYEQSLGFMAAERGASSRGLPELFALLEMRDQLLKEFPSMREESPVDRLLLEQLCQYEKIARSKHLDKKKPLQVLASDSLLHDHLAAIAIPLAQDAAALYRQMMQKQKQMNSKLEFLKSKRSEITKARKKGQDRFKDLVR